MMEEKEATAAGYESEAPEEIKVTDKRRINLENLDAADNTAPEADDPPALSAEEQIAELQAQLAAVEERAHAAERTVADIQSRFEQMRYKLQREMDETRQRLNRSTEERVQRAKGEFIGTMLPVADNLQFAIAAAEKGGSLEVLLNGVRGTAQNFLAALMAAGVEPVAAVGQPFNPEVHEAIDMRPVEEDQDGIVTAEYQRGYKMGDKLLRPARVQVGRA